MKPVLYWIGWQETEPNPLPGRYTICFEPVNDKIYYVNTTKNLTKDDLIGEGRMGGVVQLKIDQILLCVMFKRSIFKICAIST